MAASTTFVGLMSGTSLDGIDVAVVDFAGGQPEIVVARCLPFDPELRTRLLALQRPAPDELAAAAEASVALSRAYARAVAAALTAAGVRADDVRAIGCHGQTVRHRPDRGYTVQLVNGALLAELAGIDVVCDFRSRDIAAGGQGAPLVPAFHAAFMSDPGVGRAVVNVGGIANVTALPAAGRGPVIGFDCGPGNVLMDGWIERERRLAYDAGGAWAESGCVHADLLGSLLAHAYFAAPPPKSTGRDTFNLDWLLGQIDPSIPPQDVQATLLELTARTIALAVSAHCAAVPEVLVCGGGAHNGALLRRLAELLPGRQVATTAAVGIDPDWMEAIAFAWLARERVQRRAANLPSVTGAAGPRVLGCLYPA